MSVKATDADAGPNAVISYYINGPIRRKLSEGLDSVKQEPFLLNRLTGEVSLNFDPRKNMKGYFEFDVIANDTAGLKDTAKVFVRAHRD